LLTATLTNQTNKQKLACTGPALAESWLFHFRRKLHLTGKRLRKKRG